MKVNKRFTYYQISILLLAAIVYVTWAYKIGFNNGPDELMRYQVPLYIYNHKELPTGYDPEVIYHIGNWSYAFYPQLLGAIVSAIFMFMMSIFKSSDFALVFAARMASVLFGLVAVFFLGKSLFKLFNKIGIALLGMILLAFLPQFTFLCAYVNNDIIAVAGTSLIIYAMISSLKESWTVKNSIFLAVGFIVCCLGYMNSYGFVAVGGCYFLISSYMDMKHEVISRKNFIKNFILIFLLTAICVFPFLIRNYLLYKDIFGMSVFRKEYMRWLSEGGDILQKPFKNQGSLSQLIFSRESNDMIRYSFIGLFGYMSIIMGNAYYLFYSWIAVIGVGGTCLGVKKQKWDSLGKGYSSKLMQIVIWLVIGVIITISLHVYYSFMIDYQPQGRYIMSIAIPLVLLISYGMNKILDYFIYQSKQKYVLFIFLITYIYMNYLISITYVFPHL